MLFFQQLLTHPLQALVYILSIVVAITVHEFAHAWAADRFGDPTPGLQGRLSLSPFAHLDVAGSIAFLIFGFGWGKPVLYNPAYFKRHIDELWVALAGPASNILLAILINLLLVLVQGSAAEILSVLVSINIVLAAFNLIPLPPLDGSSIVAYFYPEYRSPRFAQIGGLILIGILFLAPGVLSTLLTPIIQLVTSLTHLFGLIP